MQPLSCIGVVCVVLYLLSGVDSKAFEKGFTSDQQLWSFTDERKTVPEGLKYGCKIEQTFTLRSTIAYTGKYRNKRRALDTQPGESFYGFYDERGLVNTYNSLKSVTPDDGPDWHYHPYHPELDRKMAGLKPKVNGKKEDKKVKSIENKINDNNKDDKKEVIVRMGESKKDNKQIKVEPTLKRQKRKNLTNSKPLNRGTSVDNKPAENEDDRSEEDKQMKAVRIENDRKKDKMKEAKLHVEKKDKKVSKNNGREGKKGKRAKQTLPSMKISDEDMEEMMQDVYGKEYPYGIFGGDFTTYKDKQNKAGIKDFSQGDEMKKAKVRDFKQADAIKDLKLADADRDIKPADSKPADPKPVDANHDFKPADTDKDFEPAVDNRDFKPADADKIFKPAVDNGDFKPADADKNFKPAVDNGDFKPADADKNFKPAVDNGDFKPADADKNFEPAVDNGDFKPADADKNFEPAVDNRDVKPADANNHLKPAVDNKDFKPADDDRDFKIADANKDFQPSVDKDFKPADIDRDFKPTDADNKDFKPAVDNKDLKPAGANNKFKPAVDSDFKPADANKIFKSAVDNKDFKAADADSDFKPADVNDGIKAVDTHIDFKPADGNKDVKVADGRRDFKQADRKNKITFGKDAKVGRGFDSGKITKKFKNLGNEKDNKKSHKNSHYITIDKNDKAAWKSYKKEEMQGDMPHEMDPYRTPFDSQTSPNPPTTKPTKVTPMASDNKSFTDRTYGSCYDDDDCYVGRVCLGGTCVCGEQTLCLGHKKPVCGSDGQLYPSHCELHRQACVQRKHIRIDHNVGCVSQARKSTGQVDSLPKQVQGTMCEYSVRPGVEGVLWGQQVTSSSKASMEDCRASCDKAQLTGGCVAFEYSQITRHCALYDDKEDVIFWPNPDMVYYEQIRCKKQIDPRCEFDELRVSAEQIFAMCNIKTSTDKTLEQCKAMCNGCAAFTYVPENGECEIHHNKACQNMLDERGHAHYVQKCDRKGKQCDYIEIIPGKAPFMCSTATETTTSVVECHDACVNSGCEAFKYQMGESPGRCDLYFDHSCITMLNKRKENYYVRRCNKPEECQYEEVRSPSENQQCNIMSSTVDTFRDCHTACGDCVGFRFDYQTGQCSLYDRESCLPDKKYNFYIVRCPFSKISAPRVAVSKLHRNLNLQPVQSHPLPISHEKLPEPLVLPTEKSTHKKGDIILPYDDNVIEAPPPKQEAQMDDLNKLPGQEVDPARKEEIDNRIFGDQPIIEAGEKECTKDDYEKFKAELLRYHCVKFREKDCDKTQIRNKEYVAALMFSLYDRNRGGTVETKELWESQVIYKFDKLSDMCTLVDIMTFNDDGDGILHKREFISAFDMPDEVTKQKVEIIPILATAGNGLEIQCGIHPSTDNQLIWERHGLDMALVSFPDIMVFGDGTLYFDNVGVHQTGNYTCFDRDRPGFKQVHQLQVQLKPLVTVSPSSVLMRSDHTDLFIHCHAEGVPTPKITWQINGKPLPVIPHHYIRSHTNGTLMIFNTDAERDTGEYKCVGENMAGKSSAVIQVFIHNPLLKLRKEHVKVVEQSYFIFHKNGYSVYNPEDCGTERSVKSNFGNLKYIPEELDEAPSLCEQKKPCVWGEGVAVKDKFIYVAQPYQNRVVVIDSAHTMNPVQFVETDNFPVKLYYVEHLDQVWVLCWKKDHNTGSKTIVVIRDASKDTRHHMVHTQPIGNRFDQVQDIFLPPQNDLGYPFHYGYVLHNKQQGLFKLDLSTMHYTKVMDVSSFGCVPENVAFVPIGGYIIVKCVKIAEAESNLKVSTEQDTRTLQIVIDYVTDTAVDNFTMYGTPYVSPDSRTLVTVNEVTGKILISKITEDGHLQKGFSLSVKSPVSGVSFYHSNFRTGYNLIMASAKNPVMFHVNLENGKITTIKDVDSPRSAKLWPWSASKRTVVSGSYFSDYTASPSQSSLAIVSGKGKNVHCKFFGLEGPDTLVFSTATIG